MSTRTADEIESLPYSPGVLQPREPRQAFSSEAWPARPQGQEAARTAGFPAALGWVRRLGDFLKAPISMQTLITMTRQQTVQNPTTHGGGFVLQEQQQVQRTATPTASGSAYGFGAAPQEENPPLFGRAAARRMVGREQNAPLLYPQNSRPAAGGASSGSIPREVVEEEVRRQVQQALREQQRGMQELKEENKRLRDQLTLEGGSQEQPVLPVRDRAQHSGLGVSGGDRAYIASQEQPVLPVRDRAQHSGLGVSGGDRAYIASQEQPVLPGCDRVQHPGRGVSGGDRAYIASQESSQFYQHVIGLSTLVLVYQVVIGPT